MSEQIIDLGRVVGAPGEPGEPGADGEAATIEFGEVTLTEPGSELSIVNSGTEYAAVLDFEIPRDIIGEVTAEKMYNYSLTQDFSGTYDEWLKEYLARQTDLPWCLGYFQDRSIAGSAILTPIVEYGSHELIVGDKFVAPSDGIYYFWVGGGSVTSVTDAYCMLDKTSSVLSKRLASANKTSGWTVLPEVCVADMLYTGDYFELSVYVTSGVSSCSPENQRHRFAFMRIR